MSRIRKRRILAGLVSLVMLACLLPAAAVATTLQDTGTAGGYVAGEVFREGTRHVFTSDFGGGTVVYDGEHTLTLTNVNLDKINITLGQPNCFIYAQQMQRLTVKLVGTNKIIYKSGEGIWLNYVGGLTIEGPGTLTLATQEGCITAQQVVVDGAKLTVQSLGDHYGISSGNIKVVGGSTLTVNGPSRKSKARAAVPAAISASANVTVNNSKLIVTGEIAADGDILIEDMGGKPTSEVIADGGVKARQIIVRPAPGTRMQMRASQQAGGAVEFESAFNTDQTFPDTHELFNYGYVHIKAYEIPLPQTGDHAPIALWLTLLLASGTAITVLAKRRLYNR